MIRDQSPKFALCARYRIQAAARGLMIGSRRRAKETSQMAKGQQKGNKEAKKPKADKKKSKGSASAYKQEQGKGGLVDSSGRKT